MKTFETYIKFLLDKQAENDADFAADYNRKDKDIETCASIIVEALRNGCNNQNSACNLTDEQIIGYAVHYYHEDNVTYKDLDVSFVEYDKLDNQTEIAAQTKQKVSKSQKKSSKPKEPQLIFEEDEFEDIDL